MSPQGWEGSPVPHPKRLTPGLPPTPIPGHSRVGVSFCAQRGSLPRPLLLPTDRLRNQRQFWSQRLLYCRFALDGSSHAAG